MATEDQDFEMWQGDNLAIDLEIGDEDDPAYDPATNQPRLDISLLNVRFSMAAIRKDNTVSSTPKFDKESTAGNDEIEKTDAAEGEARIKLVNADTINLKAPAKYRIQAEVIDPANNNEPKVVMEGTVTLKKKIKEDND